MNWHQGINITNDKGENIVIYLKEKGVSFRFEQISSQLKPKDRYSLIEPFGPGPGIGPWSCAWAEGLKDKSLYDLIPGKLYAIDKDTLEVFGIYKNQRELWMNLNPNSGLADLEKLSLKQQRNYLDNRIGRYFNLVKPGGTSTELGNFYICKHPSLV